MDDPRANEPCPRDPQQSNGAGLHTAGRDQAGLDVEEIKRVTSILDVLDRHKIAVEGSGLSRRAHCPFHDDGVPSLGIYLDTNRYYCFGCGAKGDVIDLVQRLESVSFREALQRLANVVPAPAARAAPAADHVAPQVTRSVGRSQAAAQDQILSRLDARWSPRLGAASGGADNNVDADADAALETLVPALLAAAAALYQENLLHTPHALAYLLARGITRSTAIEARLGFSDGISLRRFIGHDPALVGCATQVGLLDGWGHERLRERLVMPAFRGGRCIWMIGRLLGDGDEHRGTRGAGSRSLLAAATPGESRDAADGTDGTARRARPPRYLGLTLRKPLLGLDLGLGDVGHGVQAGTLRGVLVVEGIFDLLTVRAWQLPISCVALVGTHLRQDQLPDLLALAHGGPIWLGLDADEAGEMAAERLKQQLVTAGCPVDLIHRLRPPGSAKDLSEVARDAHARAAVVAVLFADRGPGGPGGPGGPVAGNQAPAIRDGGPTRQRT